MPTFFLCPAVWSVASCRAAWGESAWQPLMPVGGVGQMDNPKFAVIVQSLFWLYIERIVVFAFSGYGRPCHGKTDENASIETKDGLKAWMNKMDKAIYDMMTIWDNMKQKSFSYLLVTHHGGVLCAVCQTFAVWWVDVLTHHICRMASRRDELQIWFAAAYIIDSQ